MVDISKKGDVERFCVAEGYIKLKPETIKLIKEHKIKKGNVLTTAQIAGILAVKKTYELIPMCHPIPITSVNIDFEIFEQEIADDKIDEADKESKRENQKRLGGEFVVDDIVDESGRKSETMMNAHQLCQCQ